jgi:ribosome-associated translation inhibitor RaiA
MDFRIIHGKGISEIDPLDEKIINDIFNEYSKKLQRAYKEINYLEIYLKDYKKSKNSKDKYSIHLKVISPHPLIKSDSSDWDLKKALRIAFEKLINELEHKFHSSNQKSKTGESIFFSMPFV